MVVYLRFFLFLCISFKIHRILELYYPKESHFKNTLLNMKMSLREEKCVGDYKTYWQSKSKVRENVDALSFNWKAVAVRNLCFLSVEIMQ